MPSSLRKYSRETRDRAVRMYRGRCQDVPGEASVAAQRRVSELLDVSPATLRGWAERAEGLGHQAGTTTETAAELAALRRENVELRRANEILKTASGRADLSGAQRARRSDLPEHPLRPRARPISGADWDPTAPMPCWTHTYRANHSVYGTLKRWAEIGRRGTRHGP